MLLVERGLAESREQARRLIMGGRVRSGTVTLVQPATLLKEGASLEVLEPEPYVSRGGHKLEAALSTFKLSVEGVTALDVGASTGGFTDCLLQSGASSVIAIDVGRAQLHAKLRGDDRVTLLERTNARNLPDVGPFDLFVVDVSFISLKKILPAIAFRAIPRTPGVVLLKPQFEAGPADVPRGGVIKDEGVRTRVVADLRNWLAVKGWSVLDLIECPLRGGDGNVEYLVWLETPNRGTDA
jgi:23S rRNA (cytidine1920-2'-O)/16S rRNA (cytidine1409-2'-O)-methyltransferase